LVLLVPLVHFQVIEMIDPLLVFLRVRVPRVYPHITIPRRLFRYNVRVSDDNNHHPVVQLADLEEARSNPNSEYPVEVKLIAAYHEYPVGGNRGDLTSA